MTDRPAAQRAGILAALPVLLAAWLVAAPASAAGAAPVAGTESITQPGELTPLNSGGSATLYGIALPAGASCPGDTAHHGYHVFSYLEPSSTSVGSISFKTGLPQRGLGLIAYGRYFGAVNTAEETGAITAIPLDFTWTRVTTKDLFPNGQKSSTWNAGIACANADGSVTNYWNSQIVFTASSSDLRGFTWRVVSDPSLGSSHKWLWLGMVLIVLSIGLATLAVFLSRRNDPSPDRGASSNSDPSGPDPSAPSPKRVELHADQPSETVG
jgi:hypothetical protein